jgi:hypothetical protein
VDSLNPVSRLAGLLTGGPLAVDELASLDWERLLAHAEAHGVAALLHWKLQETGGSASLPQSARHGLAQAYYRTVVNQQLAQADLKRLQAAFEQAAVPVLALKGALLAGMLYPSPALRPLSDLDLLVRAQDLPLLLRICSRLGYRLDKVSYHAVLQPDPGGLPLEIHWTLPGGTPLTPSWWKLACSGQPQGAILLYQAAHLAIQHPAAPRLIWLYDLHLLLTHPARPFDWPALFDLAASLGWLPALSYALHAAGRFFDSPLPPGLPDPGSSFPRPGPAQWARRAWGQLGWGQRLPLAARLLFPSARYMRWRYRPQPDWLWPAYYPQRWAGLLHADGMRNGIDPPSPSS